MINTSMKKLLCLWSLLTLMAFVVNSVDISMEPQIQMIQGLPSYIFCNVGTITAGVTFFKDSKNQGNCFLPGIPCTSSDYNLTPNTTGVKLQIASVNASRDTGVWYCQHDADISTNTITLNRHSIAGVLLKQEWTEPSGPVDTFSAKMTLSCANEVPVVNFTYEDSESNTGTVPAEAVNITAKSTYNGTTCENGNNFYVITLTASDNHDLKNRQGVHFTFNYYGYNITTPFTIDFIKVCDCGDDCTIAGSICIGIVVAILITFRIVCTCSKNIKVILGFFIATVVIAGGTTIEGATCTGVTGSKYTSCSECDTALGLSISALIIGPVTVIIASLECFLRKAGVPFKRFCGCLAYPGNGGKAPTAEDDVEKKDEKNVEKKKKNEKKKEETDKRETVPLTTTTQAAPKTNTNKPTQPTRDLPAPQPTMKPKEETKLGELRNAPRPTVPSPRVAHSDDDSASSLSNVSPKVEN